MSTASSVGMIVSGIILGVFVGVGGIYMDVIPNPQAQVLELRLEDSGEEIDELAGEVIDLQEEISQKSSQLSSVESSITELEEERNILLEEVSQKVLELDSNMRQLIDLGEQLTVEEDRASQLEGENQMLQQSNEALQVQLDSLNTVMEERDDLLNEVSELNQRIFSLTNNRNTLQLQVNSLNAQLVTLQRDYDELKVRWDLWKAHSNLAPRANDEIEFLGSQGDTLLISFSNPGTCLSFGRLVGSGSMQPAMGAGHMALATTCFDYEDLQPGDIIVYRENGNFIIHQIIEIRAGEGVISKGINNEISDPLVPWEAIESLVVAIVY